MVIANTVFSDEKNGSDVISTLSDVQLGASTIVRRVLAMSGNLTEQLDRDLAKCRWFSIQCDESGKKVLHFPSVQSVLHDNASASGAFDKAAEKYFQVINRLGQEFENRFCDFGQLEPCVSFISNPVMQVDLTCIAEQLSATFNVDAGQVEIEILTLQNDLHLKAHQKHAQQLLYESCLPFWFNLAL
ncbi:hypothetical protein F7725_026900 [Dissostichus mawsoni]|uniref:Uncharacterized protein n=1 Tax=Dissostichus mawsoni TaxID=36200 RepID=A0A7J5X8D9_DISMA|nr:hypothetical protein F7725_026900 [Dissostichus mawsoni]